MARIDFRKLLPLQRCLFALVVALMWCTVSAAYQGHWHDHVTISGTPAGSVTVGQTYSFTPTASDSQDSSPARPPPATSAHTPTS